MSKVCLVLGAGRGLEQQSPKICPRRLSFIFMPGGSDQSALEESIAEIKNQGGLASGELIDATKENVIEELIEKIEKDIGAIEVLIYNLGAQVALRILQKHHLKNLNGAGKWQAKVYLERLKYFVL